ncbi:hypothetical protein Tco_0789736 [Tanacetum coccineum]
MVEDIPVDVPNILPTHPTLHMDFDFIPSHNDLGSNLDVSSPSEDRNKIYDPRICIEVESMKLKFSIMVSLLRRRNLLLLYHIGVSKLPSYFIIKARWLFKAIDSLIPLDEHLATFRVPPPHPLIYNRPKKLDLSYSGLDEFKEPEFKEYRPENSKQESNIVCDKKSDESKENSDKSLVKEQVSKDTSSFVESLLNVDKETIFPVDKKAESVKPKDHEKLVKKSVRYAEMYRSQTPRGNQRNWNRQKSNQLGSDFVMYNKACFIFGSFNHVQAQCKYHQKEGMAQAVNTAKPQVVNTARPNTVKTARPNSTVVNAVRVNQANAGKPQQDDTGFVDSGCSRHMTGNIAYLSDFKDFSGSITPLFETMMVQPTQDEGVDSGIPADSLQTPIATQPSSSRSQ